MGGKFAFDEDNKMIAEIEDETFAGANETVYRKLKLYNENKEYSLNLKTRNCTVYPPHPHWHPYGAPPDAKLVFDATVGAVGVTGEHVVAAVFESRMGNDTLSVTVSEPHCFPIHSRWSGLGRDGKPDFDVRDFYNGIEGWTTQTSSASLMSARACETDRV